MARRIAISLIDDIDGTQAQETVTFALDGVDYEIDLTRLHAEELRQVLALYCRQGRRVPAGRAKRSLPSSVPHSHDSATVRAWAGSNGVEVPRRGPIPKAVVEQFHAAGH